MQKSKLMELVNQKYRQMSKADQNELRVSAMRHASVTVCLRCKIIRNLVRGFRPTAIHHYLECSRSTITRLMRRFIDEGLEGLLDKRSGNGNRKVMPEHEEFVEHATDQSPMNYGFQRSTWTLELFLKLLQKNFVLKLSGSTMSRLLNFLRIKRKYPKPFLKCPWSKRRKNRRLDEIDAMIESAGEDEVILYVDEVDIHLNPKIGRDWMTCGTQKKVLTPGQNKKRYLAGSLNHRTGRLTYVEAERKDSHLFIDQLWTLVQNDYPDARRIHVILDNYSIHHSGLTQIAVDALSDKLTLHFLPPYCPDSNRIERKWKDLHDNVTRNHSWKTINELMRAVRRYIKSRNKDAINQLAI